MMIRQATTVISHISHIIYSILNLIILIIDRVNFPFNADE